MRRGSIGHWSGAANQTLGAEWRGEGREGFEIWIELFTWLSWDGADRIWVAAGRAPFSPALAVAKF
jgi:hypothetical protein